MPDAEVIPIGGRGRPGRGSSTSPSAAARALAPKPPQPGSSLARAKAKSKTAEPKPRQRATPVAAAAPDESAYRAEDIADAVRDAAHETFGGGGWEQQLAQVLAFVRRRLTGEYEVDEFGFDPEITDQVPADRAAADGGEVVPGRGPRDREHPGRRRRAGGRPTTPARCRSTG